MAFLGYPRGHRITTRRLGANLQHTERLMSAWILSLEAEHRRTDGHHRGMKPEITWGSVQCSSCLRLQLFSVETFLLLPKCQSNGRDPTR